MHKTILIAGLVAVVTAGTALAQPQPPPPPAPSQAGPGFDGPRGFRDGQGFRGGPGGMRGFRGRGMRQPPTAQEIQQRNAAMFARADANRDGRLTFEEFRADRERQRAARQREMFQRFTGGQDSVTLDQLNARSLERLNDRAQRRGRGPGQTPPPPPAAR